MQARLNMISKNFIFTTDCTATTEQYKILYTKCMWINILYIVAVLRCILISMNQCDIETNETYREKQLR